MNEEQDERGDQFTYLKIIQYLLNPPVEEGEREIHYTLQTLTSKEIVTFCTDYYLNPVAVKKALELRFQYSYFLQQNCGSSFICRLLPQDMVDSLREEEKNEEKNEDDLVMICLIKAYFNNICKLSSNGCYVPVNLLNEEGSNEGNIDVLLHEDSILRFTSIVDDDEMIDVQPPSWVLFKDIQLTDSIYIRDVVAVNPRLVTDSVPRLYKLDITIIIIIRSIQSMEQAPGPQLPPGPYLPTNPQEHVAVDIGKLGMEDKLRDVFRFCCVC